MWLENVSFVGHFKSWSGRSVPVKDPWSRVIRLETDGDVVAFCFANVHNISLDGVQEVVARIVSALDDTEPVLFIILAL